MRIPWKLLTVVAKVWPRPTFKHPDIVKIATIIAGCTIWLTLHHQPYLDKFGFELAMGFGVMFIMAASTALKRGAGNTAVYIVGLGFAMLMSGFTFTDAESISSLAVDAIEPQIIGAVGGLFTTALINDMHNGEDGD